jgi:hypothetical protein
MLSALPRSKTCRYQGTNSLRLSPILPTLLDNLLVHKFNGTLSVIEIFLDMWLAFPFQLPWMEVYSSR